MEETSLLLAVLLLALGAFAFLWTLRERAFSSLYWLSLIAVFMVPAVTDVLYGLPALAYLGTLQAFFPNADLGIRRALWFALGHVCTTIVVYHGATVWFAARHKPARDGPVGNWMRQAGSVAGVLFVFFVASAAIVLVYRGDLTLQFNDFLEPDSRPQYETYFLLASTPLMALLVEGGRSERTRALLLAGASVVVAYFIGIRYYMFPFIGYLIWMKLLHGRGALVRRVSLLVGVVITAWLALTTWGIVRSLGVRSNPLAMLEVYESSQIKERMLAGNELATRLAYYDLMIRLAEAPSFGGWSSVQATLLAAPYPMLLRPFGLETPLSNAKRVYDLESGTTGTGRSTGMTVFGNEWFTWGWWGMLVGGLGMGAILAVTDEFHRRRNAPWLLLGPMATFQMIFFARGGTDVWVGLWGRFLPLTLAAILLARLFDSQRRRARDAWPKRQKVGRGTQTGREVRTPCLDRHPPSLLGRGRRDAGKTGDGPLGGISHMTSISRA